jgi:Ser/Thr protein kinase RdoA (MazF antagonist)
MSLLQQAPRFALADAARLARDMYGLDAAASPLPSERDQNFLLTTARGDRYVLKVANAAEDRAMLEAQNAAMTHLAGPPTRLRRFGGTGRMAICPRVLPTVAGETIGLAPGGAHFVRLVTYLTGVPFAEVRARTPALFESLGRVVGRLDAALADFDHPAIHRDFHWDLAKAASVIDEHLPQISDEGDRALVHRLSAAALQAIEPHRRAFRRSAVHHDANDWNVLVSNPDSRTPNPDARIPTPEPLAIIDFGDMVHSWTVADPAVAVAYAILDAADPLATADAVVGGYHAEYPLRDEEAASVFPLAALRLCMSACIAAWQQQQRPDDQYLAVSQQPIRRTLPALASILERRG